MMQSRVANGTLSSNLKSGFDAKQLSPSSVPRALKRLAWSVFAVQLAGLFTWSFILWSRFALTGDAGDYLHESFLIASRHLDAAAIHLHFDLLMWPLSIITAPWPKGPMLLWEQDIATVGAEVVAFHWICHVVESGWRPKHGSLSANWVVLLGLLVLVANPWIYWTDSFDIHPDATIPTFFALLAAYDLSQKNYRRAWIWVALVLLNGDIAGLFILGLGLSALIAAWAEGRLRRDLLWLFIGLSATGVGWEIGLSHIGGTSASPLKEYAYLVSRGQAVTPLRIVLGIVQHPTIAAKALWSQSLNIYANTAPSGMVGFLNPWCFGVPFVFLIINQLPGNPQFGRPSFQSFPIYAFGAIGLIAVLCLITRHVALPSSVTKVLLGVFALNVLFWGVIWIPQAKVTWLRISASQAQVLSEALRIIPQNDEVIAEQGIVSRFAQRQSYLQLDSPGIYRVTTPTVWLVFAPSAGIELLKSNIAEQIIAELAKTPNVNLVLANHGIWLFRWDHLGKGHSIVLGANLKAIPSWTAPGAAGTVAIAGPPKTWHVSSNGRTGYIVEGDYWEEPVGSYEVQVKLESSAPLNAEIWNATSDRMIARIRIPPTIGINTVTLKFNFTDFVAPSSGFTGWGPFKILPIPNSPNDRLEVRIWTPRGGSASVYGISIRRVTSS